MNAETPINPFLQLWQNGYTRIVPVVPVGAKVRPKSSLNRPGSLGKVPGLLGQDGLWHGYDFVAHENDALDLVRWQRMGADVGLKGGRMPDDNWLVFLDADTKDPALAALIEGRVDALSPGLPKRIGQAPKAAYPIRVSGEFPYTRIDFGKRDEKGRAERFEILSESRHLKVYGLHPVTGELYYWPRKLVPYAELPIVTPEQLLRLLNDLREILPAASEIIREGSTANVNQESLRGDPALVAKAVALIPNTSELFPSRESYRDIGYAIKASLPDDEPAAFALFEDWCGRWDKGVNETDVIRSDWSRMKPNFKRGASWLYELAERYAPNQFSRAEQWWDEDVARLAIAAAQAVPSPAGAHVFEMLTPGQIISRQPLRYVIERYLPERSLGFLYGNPGSRKSFMALDWAMTLATGKADCHGYAVDADPTACVIYIAGEGAHGMRPRMLAWARQHGLSEADLAASRFRLLPTSINMMEPAQVRKLARTIRLDVGRACLVVIDTVSRAMPGADENLQAPMSLFVQQCDAIKDEFECVVLGVHHANQRGGLRGSGVLTGAGDFVHKLSKEKGKASGTLWCEKMKDGPDGWEEAYRFDVVEVEGGSSLVPSRCIVSVGSEANPAPGMEAQVLEAMQAAWVAKAPWCLGAQGGARQAIKRMIDDFGFSRDAAAATLRGWTDTGRIELCVFNKSTKARGYRVTYKPAEIDDATPDDGVFG